MSARSAKPLPFLPRLIATATALAVAALAILAASPGLHAWLHGHAESDGTAHAAHGATCPHGHPAPASPPVPPTDHDDALCIVTQFAHGGVEPFAAPLTTLVPRARVAAILASVFHLAPSAPAHLLPPGCGPPLV